MKYRTTVTKRMNFCYGHFLPGYDGKCSEQHGHNSMIEVSVSRSLNGINDTPDGMIEDFGVLKAHINKVLLSKIDHKNINDISPIAFGRKFEDLTNKMIHMPTAENMVDLFWWKLNEKYQDWLECVRIYETPDCWVERRRND